MIKFLVRTFILVLMITFIVSKDREGWTWHFWAALATIVLYMGLWEVLP